MTERRACDAGILAGQDCVIKRSRGRIVRIAKCQERSVPAAVAPNFCCNFVNESKSTQNSANNSQHRKLPSSRKRTDLAENEDDTESGVRDLKSFVLNGTCGFDPHPGHFIEKSYG